MIVIGLLLDGSVYKTKTQVLKVEVQVLMINDELVKGNVSRGFHFYHGDEGNAYLGKGIYFYNAFLEILLVNALGMGIFLDYESSVFVEIFLCMVNFCDHCTCRICRTCHTCRICHICRIYRTYHTCHHGVHLLNIL